MNDKFVNSTGVQTIKTWIDGKFGTKTEVNAVDDKVDALENKVDGIIAEGGEPNVIDTVKVNGTALIPDAQKGVNVEVPTATSDLTNDGDGQSPYATEEYVNLNGGKIDVIKVNGTAQTITNKEVDIPVPTKLSELTNDENFIKNTVDNLTNYYKKSETYTQSEVNSMISAAKTGRFVPVETLPTQDIDTTVIYLVPKTDAGTKDLKDEYINLDGTTAGWELIGSTKIDLSNYWNNTNLQALTVAEINAILEPSA